MSDLSIGSLREEWKKNPRLRLGVLAITGITLLYLFLVLSDYETERVKYFDQVARQYLKLKKGGLDENWLRHYDEAKAFAQLVESRVWKAKSRGLAQAMVQSWAEELIKKYAFNGPSLRVEQAYDITDAEGLWQVAATLEAEYPPGNIAGLLHEIESSEKLLSIERLIITEAAQSIRNPKRFTLGVKAYFKLEDSKG